MVPAVAIDVPPQTAQEVRVSVVRSCNAALGRGRCVLGRPEPDQPFEWVAVVRWDPGYRRLRIELRRRSVEGELVESRDLAFTGSDATGDRWASAGVVIAALVAARQPSVIRYDTPSEPEQNAPAEPPVEKEPRWTGGPVWSVEVGAHTGPGLDSGPYRFGPQARIGVSLRPLPLLLTAATRYSIRSGDPNISWWAQSLGVGARVGGWEGSVAAELRSEIVSERMVISATDERMDSEESAVRARFGGRLGAVGLWLLAPRVWLTGAAEVTLLRPEVSVEVSGSSSGYESAVRWGMAGGVRYSF